MIKQAVDPAATKAVIDVVPDLQASNQVFMLEPYHRSLNKRNSKTPKLYFTDSGLAAYLVGVASADALWSSREAGAFWENHVVCQWLRWRDWHEPSLGLW